MATAEHPGPAGEVGRARTRVEDQRLVTGQGVPAIPNMPLVPMAPNPKVPPYEPLAIDTVRCVGTPVVAVAAETRGQAVDAAQLVDVEYEPVDAVADAEAALADD